MLDPAEKLPHEERHVLPLAQSILNILLHRNPAERITSSALVKRLEQDMPTGVQTENPGPIITEDHIVLPGLCATTVERNTQPGAACDIPPEADALYTVSKDVQPQAPQAA